MAHAAPVRTKIPTKIPQPAGAGASSPAWPKARRAARSRVLASGTGRPPPRGGDPVIELEYGITVYPARRPHFRAGEFRHKYAQSLGNISFEQWRSTFSQPVLTHVECIIAWTRTPAGLAYRVVPKRD